MGNIFFSVVCPWLVWMGIMTIMLLEVSAKHADHTEMPPVLTKGVGYWELGDTWESTIFTYFQVCPLIWCGMCYSLGTKFRKSIVSNTPMIAVWGAIFIFYTVALLVTPGKFSAFFHVASNGHNGFHTTSPVWMRYQMPRGCPSYNFTSNTEGSLAGCKTGQDCGSLVYAQAVGMDTWRSNDLPTPYVDERTNECAIIKMSVNKCKTACDNWVPGVPSPGMDAEIRGTLFGCSSNLPSTKCTSSHPNGWSTALSNRPKSLAPWPTRTCKRVSVVVVPRPLPSLKSKRLNFQAKELSPILPLFKPFPPHPLKTLEARIISTSDTNPSGHST